MSTKAPRTKKLVKVMKNGRTPNSVNLNLWDRLILISALNSATPSIREARQRQKLYRKLSPDAGECKTFKIEELKPGRFRHHPAMASEIESSPGAKYDLSDEEKGLVSDIFSLGIETGSIGIDLPTLDLMEKFLSEAEMDALVEEMETAEEAKKTAEPETKEG